MRMMLHSGDPPSLQTAQRRSHPRSILLPENYVTRYCYINQLIRTYTNVVFKTYKFTILRYRKL